MIPIADDLLFWRERADGARMAAQQMDQRCRDAVFAIADSYERMALMAERRTERRALRCWNWLGWSIAFPLTWCFGVSLIVMLCRP